MRESPFHTVFFPLWAMFLMVILGSADSFSAYSLEDNEQWKKYNWLLGIKFVLLALVLSSRYYEDTLFRIALCLIVVFVFKSRERALALEAASRHSLERSTKVIADYMSKNHEEDSADGADAFCMKNCYYLVRGEEEKWENILGIRHFKWWKDKMMPPELASSYRRPLKITDEVITLEKVWKCQGRLLREEDLDNKVKDYCLSFALCKLLRLRYAGYSLPREVHQKTWILIQNELLSQPDGHQRAFRVVEIELSYLFDFFYTKYGVIFYPGRLYVKLAETVYFSLGIWVTTVILIRVTDDIRKIHSFVSAVMILALIAIELVQLSFICFSDWTKVICICQYVQRKSWQKKWIERMMKFMCRVQILRPWERKLRQYSFLEFYSYTPCRLIYNKILASYIDRKRNGQRQSKPIKLSEDVMKAVLATLKSNCHTEQENGQVLLRINHVPKKLSWACELETNTQVIMLLPDHPYITECVFDQVILEARSFFNKCKNMKDRIEEMKKQCRLSDPKEQTVIRQGAWLGNQIIVVEDEARIWKILADFWVEMMLYVAPLADTKAHIEHLTKGGEFVTHLWALLSHAGVERKVPSKTTGGHNHESGNSSPNRATMVISRVK